jgi:hypothetical protein
MYWVLSSYSLASKSFWNGLFFILKNNSRDISVLCVGSIQNVTLKRVLLSYCYRPPLWSSGQSSWLQIQRSGFYSRRYQILGEAVGLERGPLNLVSTIEHLFEWESSGSGLESREYGRGVPLCWHPLSTKVGTNFAAKRRSLGRSRCRRTSASTSDEYSYIYK